MNNPMQSSTGKGPSLTMIGTAILTLMVMGLTLTGNQDRAEALQAESENLIKVIVAIVGAVGTVLSVYGKIRSNRVLDRVTEKRIRD